MKKSTAVIFIVHVILLASTSAKNKISQLNGINGDSSIVQLSTVSKNSNVRLLKASLIPCVSQEPAKCKAQVEINAWLDFKDSYETFLLIDEVRDSKHSKNYVLLDPYLIQVSMIEQNMMFPLEYNQMVIVSCNSTGSVQRREAESTKGGRSLEGLSEVDKNIYVDASENNFPRLSSNRETRTDGMDSADGKNLLLYFNDVETSTQAQGYEQVINVKSDQNFRNVSKQFDPTRQMSTMMSMNEDKNARINQNFGEQQEPRSVLPSNEFQSPQNYQNLHISPIIENRQNIIDDSNHHHINHSPYQLHQQLINSDKNLDSNSLRFPVVDIRDHGNHHRSHPQRLSNSYQNQFYINQNANENEGEMFEGNELMGMPRLAGAFKYQSSADGKVGNDWKRTKISLKIDSIENPIGQSGYISHWHIDQPINIPGSLMIREKYQMNPTSHEPKQHHGFQTEKQKLKESNNFVNANGNLQIPNERSRFHLNNGERYDEFLHRLHKSPSVDNRNIPIDLFSESGNTMKRLKDVNEHHQNLNIAASDLESIHNNDGEVQENANVFSELALEPDNEDDPNLLVEREKLETSWKNLQELSRRTANRKQSGARFKRFLPYVDDDAFSMQTQFADQTKELSSDVECDSTIESMEKQVSDNDFQKQKAKDDLRFKVYGLRIPALHHSSAKVQVFQKHQGKWIRLQPEIAVTSESGNYTSGAFRVYSTARKSLNKLFDVKQTFLIVPSNETSLGSLLTLENQLMQVSTEEIKQAICQSNDKLSDVKRSVKTLQESGLMPRSGDAITRCPLNANQTCLRLRDDGSSTLRLEIQLPFDRNQIIDLRLSSVKISNIFIDSSDGRNLYAQFEITSMDHFTKAFNLTFNRCELLQQLNFSHSVLLPPNKSMMVNLTVPLPFFAEHSVKTCEVNIIDESMKVIARREFKLDPRGARCVCLWFCSCFCFGSFLTVESNDLCHQMTTRNEIYAGFYDEKIYEEIEDEMETSFELKRHLMMLPVAVILFALMMGFLKSVFGLCSTCVGAWMFNYVQPSKAYRESSGCRRFVVNLLFFFLLPIAWCTNCCCCSSSEKRKMDSDTSFCGQKVVRQEFYSDEESDGGGEGEDVKLLNSRGNLSDFSSVFEKYRRSSETVFDARSLRNPFDRIEPKEKVDLEADMNFIVNAINESHESLCKLESHHSEVNIINDHRFQEAQKLVKDLLAMRIVYRRFKEPLGSVNVKSGQHYSIRGYFIPAQGPGYQFMTYNPIKQIYEVSSTSTLISIAPQIQLDSRAFRRFYSNKIEVLEANDLSVRPSPSAPCLNVLVQDSTMYNPL